MDTDSDCDVNAGWSAEAHYTPVATNSRNMSIRDQPGPMKKMLRGAVHQVTGDVLFNTAYPAVDTAEHENYHRDVLLKSAQRLKFHELVKRIKSDEELVKLSARVVMFILFKYRHCF